MKSKYKIISVILLISLTTAVITTACKKYPEGPAISLRTKSERLANTWKIENYKINGNDYTSLLSDYKETFIKEGSYYYDWGILDGNGTWAFQNSNKEIQLTGNDHQSNRTFFILQLREETLWYYYIHNDEKHELHLVPN